MDHNASNITNYHHHHQHHTTHNSITLSSLYSKYNKPSSPLFPCHSRFLFYGLNLVSQDVIRGGMSRESFRSTTNDRQSFPWPTTGKSQFFPWLRSARQGNAEKQNRQDSLKEIPAVAPFSGIEYTNLPTRGVTLPPSELFRG